MSYTRVSHYRQIMPAPSGLVAVYGLSDGTLFTEPIVAFALAESWRTSPSRAGLAVFDPETDDDFCTEVTALTLDSHTAALTDPSVGCNYLGSYWSHDMTDGLRAELVADWRAQQAREAARRA